VQYVRFIKQIRQKDLDLGKSRSEVAEKVRPSARSYSSFTLFNAAQPTCNGAGGQGHAVTLIPSLFEPARRA